MMEGQFRKAFSPSFEYDDLDHLKVNVEEFGTGLSVSGRIRATD
jgi:hypothetical protein